MSEHVNALAMNFSNTILLTEADGSIGLGTLLHPDTLDSSRGCLTDNLFGLGRRDDDDHPIHFFGQGGKILIGLYTFQGFSLGMDGI